MAETLTRERPILFSAPMVRAILSGAKTQTRRIIKPQPTEDQWIEENNGRFTVEFDTEKNGVVYCEHHTIRCPYGKVGTRLWVRETWARSRNNWLYAASEIYSEGPQGCVPEWDWDLSVPNNWRPSIFMPRRASRITLEITGIRVERVQEITEEDAKAEGVQPMHLDDLGQTWKTYRRGFESIWHKINGAESWGDNPWVWVVKFRDVSKEQRND